MKKFSQAFICFSLTFSLASTPILAADIDVKNPTVQSGTITVSGISIDGVDAPKVGKKLDCSAVVRTKEGYSWEIAVIWLTKDGKIATLAKDGEAYFPTLAFYVPPKYRLASDSFKVSLSSSLSKLLGSKDIISVFDSSTGLTFVLPSTINSLSSATDNAASNAITGLINTERTTRWNNAVATTVTSANSETMQSYAEASPSDNNSDSASSYEEPPAQGIISERSVIDLYCSQTAKDAINEDALERLADIIINKLQPQAVELLINSFPAFKTASDNGEIGREIGLYIYYEKGDDDGLPEHKTAPDSLAYVAGDAAKTDGELKYSYLLAIDVNDLTYKDKDNNPIKDESTGKYNLTFEGETFTTLNNTIVHEMFHAFMDDYNRTGMVGVETLEQTLDDGNGYYIDPEAGNIVKSLKYPYWFIEGTASSVENNLQFRKDNFHDLRATKEGGTYYNEYTNQNVLDNYLSGKAADGSWNYFDLEYQEGIKENGKDIEPTVCRYFTGYLATIYLSEIAYQAITGTSVDSYVITADSSARYRDGLSFIMEQMHNGSTLDEVISSISPIVENEKLYSSTEEFEKEFIKGPELKDKPGYYSGDGESLAFVTSYCNYMLNLENDSSRECGPNGSILFALDDDFNVPVDPNKNADSEFYKIVDSNCYVASTVKPDVTVIGGGKSTYTPESNSTSLQEESRLAAKTGSVQVKDATEPDENEVVEASESNPEVVFEESSIECTEEFAEEPEEEPTEGFDIEAPIEDPDKQNPTKELTEESSEKTSEEVIEENGEN